MDSIDEKETTDQVVQEIRRTKQALAEAMDFDLDRILEDARRKQNESDRKVLSPAVRQDT